MPPPPHNDSKLVITDDHLALLFPYVPDQIAELKTIPGAKWDKLSRTWRVPMGSLAETLAFARKHGFEIDPDLTAIEVPHRPHADARIEKGKKGVLLAFFPFDEVKVKEIKKVPGIRWDPDLRGWAAPTSSVRELVEWAGDWGARVPADIDSLAHQVAEGEAGLYGLSSLTHLQEPLVIPELAMDLYDFQHVGVKYASEVRRTFIADQMGLGKTAQAIATLANLDSFPAVVVAPPSLVLNWVYEINQWLPNRKVVMLQGMAKKAYTDSVLSSKNMAGKWDTYHTVNQLYGTVTPKTAPVDATVVFAADILVVGYATLGAWLPLLQDVARAVVFDESQYIKNPAAKRTKSAIKLGKQVGPDGVVLCLTGTPVASRPSEYAAQLMALGKIQEFGGEWAFYKRYCGLFRDKWGQWHKDGHTNTEELNRKLRSMCYVRRLKHDVLPELGERRSVPLYVEPDLKVMKEYHKAERDIATYMAERAAEIARELGTNPHSAAVMARIKAEAAEHLVRMSVLRRIAAKAKLPAVEELVTSHIEEGSKVVLAAHHRDVVLGLSDKFGGYHIIGGQSVDEVERFKERFQNRAVEDVPVIVLSTQAAKTGHTLTAAQDIIMVELPWTPADFDQTVDRLHRIGQEGSVLATSVLVPDTIDEWLWELLERKRRVVDAVTDGTPLVDEGGSVAGELAQRFTLMGLA